MEDGKESYHPAKDLAAIAVSDVYHAIRGAPTVKPLSSGEPAAMAAQLCTTLDAAGLEAVGQRSLLDVVRDR